LKVIDLGHEKTPRLIESKILDPKNFEVDSAGSMIAYVRSGVDRDSSSATYDGVFTVTLH
jgi:hypothetical protein